MFSFDTLAQRLRELAFLNGGIVITLDDERDGEEPQVPVRRRHRLVRPAPEHEQARGEREADLHAGRKGRHRRRNRPAVERRLRRDALLVRQQHQHARGRHSSLRVPVGIDPDGQLLREQEQSFERPEGERQRRRHPRRIDGGRQRQDPASAVRRPDQDQARQHRGQGHRRSDRQRQARRLSRGEPGRRPQDHRQGDRCGPRPRSGEKGP